MVYRVPLWRRREIRGLSTRDLRTTLPIFRIELDVFTPFFVYLCTTPMEWTSLDWV
jgi:hypothetical protein